MGGQKSEANNNIQAKHTGLSCQEGVRWSDATPAKEKFFKKRVKYENSV